MKDRLLLKKEIKGLIKSQKRGSKELAWGNIN
jgi:hypothetical protein